MSELGAADHSVSVDLSMQEVKDMYNKALRYTPTSELLTDQQMTDVKDMVSNDNRLEEYLTSFNVDSLPERLINFYEDEDLINKLNELIHYMEYDLRSSFMYPGHIVRVGSCRDESRVGQFNEIDTLYVINMDFASEWRKSEEGYVINTGGQLVSALELIDEFANAVEISAQKWQSTDTVGRLQHGGFASPTFTGVRYNGPAVTLLFTYEYKKDAIARVLKDISLDMTLAFSLPPEHGLRKHICKQLSVVQEAHTGKVISKDGVHFVPNVVNGLWMVTTAQLEADLFHSLPNDSVVKQAFRFVKIISHDINEHKTINEHVSVPDVLPIKTVLNRWKCMSPSELKSRDDSFIELKRTMRYAHSLLSPRDAKEHNESVKEEVSINTTALKHVLLNEALKATRYLTHTTTFNEDVNNLVVEALSVVLHGGSTVPHALIDDTEINMFSLSKPAVLREGLDQLKAVLRETCRRLVLKIKPEAHLSESVQTSNSEHTSDQPKASTSTTSSVLTVTVLRKGEITKYTNQKTNQVNSYFSLVGANDQGYHHIKVFNVNAEPKIMINFTVKFECASHKGSIYYIGPTAKVSSVQRLNLPDHINVTSAPPLPDTPDERTLKTIQECLDNMGVTSTIRVKVVQASTPKSVQGGRTTVRVIGVKDSSHSTVKMALFDDAATSHTFSRGDTIEVKGVYSRKRNDFPPQLTSSKRCKTEINFLHPDTVDTTIDDADCLSDSDFKEEKKPVHTWEVTGVDNASTYHSCPKPGCYFKKLADNQCPTCLRCPEVPTTSCVAKLHVQDIDDKQEQTITVFADELRQILGSGTELDLSSTQSLLAQIVNSLPLSFSARVKNEIPKNITKL